MRLLPPPSQTQASATFLLWDISIHRHCHRYYLTASLALCSQIEGLAVLHSVAAKMLAGLWVQERTGPDVGWAEPWEAGACSCKFYEAQKLQITSLPQPLQEILPFILDIYTVATGQLSPRPLPLPLSLPTGRSHISSGSIQEKERIYKQTLK